MTVLRAELELAKGTWLVRAPNGVSFVVEDLAVTGSAGSEVTGWWLRCVRGPRAWTRYRDWFEAGVGPSPEWHEVGTFPTLRDARRAAVEHSKQARRERVA